MTLPSLTEIYQEIAKYAPPCADDRTEKISLRDLGTLTVTDLYGDFNGVSYTHPQAAHAEEWK